MSTLLSMTRDNNGYVVYSLIPPIDIKSALLIQNDEDSFTIPANFQNWVIIFSYDPGLRVFVAHNGTASVPAADFSDGNSVLLPSEWTVQAGDTISCITPDTTCLITVSLYAIQP